LDRGEGTRRLDLLDLNCSSPEVGSQVEERRRGIFGHCTLKEKSPDIEDAGLSV
jgi:hypothetical protein